MVNEHALVLALGDSLVSGHGLARGEGLVPQLEQRLRARRGRARVVDAGVSGDTSADIAARLPRVLSSLNTRPDLALVQVGPNDVLRGVSPVAVRANLSATVAMLRDCEVPVLLTRVEPPAILRARAAPYDTIHAKIARAHGASLCRFFPDGVLGHPDMVLPDRVHPNARAVAAVANHLLPLVEQMLDAGTVSA